tara:strand:+ start:3458 stop:4006 length:549 start_codon:yes stop_codon:yes gene_type:complete
MNKKPTSSQPSKSAPEPMIKSKYVYKDVDTRNFINKPIAQRNIPSKTLESAYITHPVSTRKVIMPIIDSRKKSSVEKMKYSIYNSSDTFHPGQTAPYNGYAQNVDHESLLFNRFAPLQRGGQHEYIPGTNSHLYKEQKYVANKEIPFKHLNKEELFNPFNPNCYNLANNMFQNHTRQQTKDL